MTYTKPEINLLGDAARVIQEFGKDVPQDPDPNPPPALIHPAYDLDE